MSKSSKKKRWKRKNQKNQSKIITINSSQETGNQFKTQTTTENKTYVPPIACHIATEIYEGLILCKRTQAIKTIKDFNIDIVVPLVSCDADIWENGFEGDIFYVPIEDFNVLPPNIAIKKAQQVAQFIKDGKRCIVFCMGGHGRTGYFASLILGLLGVEDPIETIRKNYCDKTIESYAQIKQIADLLEKPELATKHEPAKIYSSVIWNTSSWGKSNKEVKTKADEKYVFQERCRDCTDFKPDDYSQPYGSGTCWLDGQECKGFDSACNLINKTY